MLEMNDKKLCDLCFSEMTENGMCNVCHIWGADTAIDCLPAGTVLRGKYAVGKTMNMQDEMTTLQEEAEARSVEEEYEERYQRCQQREGQQEQGVEGKNYQARA